MCPEPILCFDGDSAGQKAGFRAIDTVLPHLKPGFSVGFAFLPGGLDPDDLIRQQGADAMREVLADAKPLVDLLFAREWGSGLWYDPGAARQPGAAAAQAGRYDRGRRAFASTIPRRSAPGCATPGEPRAAASQTMPRDVARRGAASAVGGRAATARLLAGRMAPAVLVDGFQAAAGPSRCRRRRRLGAAAGERRVAPQRAGRPAERGIVPYREALLMAALLNHPWLLEDQSEEIASIDFTSPALGKLRSALLSLDLTDKFT